MRGLASKYVIFLSVIMSLSGVISESLRERYCKLCKDHTLCVYVSAFKNPCEAHKITKEEFLEYHNSVRDKVARGKYRGRTGLILKPAKNMVMMRWDPELSTIARVLVKQCATPFISDSCRNVERKGSVIHPRQNLGQGPILGGLESVFQHWIDESEHLTEEMITRFPAVPESEEERKRLRLQLLSITNVIWAEHDLVGCASAKVSEELRVVCNYMSSFGTQGGTAGRPVYEIGDSRSHCPDEFEQKNSTYLALCNYNGGKRMVANSYNFFMIFLGYKVVFYSLIH